MHYFHTPTSPVDPSDLSGSSGPKQFTTFVSDEDVSRVRSFFDRALDQFYLAAPSVIFTQILNPILAKLAVSSGHYSEHVSISPEDLRDFVVKLIYKGPNSSEVIEQTDKMKRAYESLDVPIKAEELSFLAYTLTAKLMQALEKFGGVTSSKEEQVSWFKVMSLATERLGSTEITDDYDQFKTDQSAIELGYLQSTDRVSIAVAEEAIKQFTKPLPFAIRPFAKPAILSVLEPEIRSALKLPEISESKQEFYRSILQRVGKLIDVRGVVTNVDSSTQASA